MSKNYSTYFEKLKTTLCEAGEDLPRLLMYQQLLPTKRMQGIVANLYAQVVAFLQQAIIFYRKSKFSEWYSCSASLSPRPDRVHREVYDGPVVAL